MSADPQHEPAVSAWLAGVDARSATEDLPGVLLDTLRALWQRAHGALGGLTLYAIVLRVLTVARRAVPALPPMTVTPAGIEAEARDPLAPQPARAQLLAALRFVVLEFVTVLGDLTGEILTPALHYELAKMTPARPITGRYAVKPVRSAGEAPGESPQK